MRRSTYSEGGPGAGHLFCIFAGLDSYTFHINLYDLAFLGALFIQLTFALLLWFTPTINRGANRFLALALATVILWMIRVLAIDIRLQAYLPHWDWLPMQFLLALGPLLYFYVRKITCPDCSFKGKDWFHFSPLLLEQGAQLLEMGESNRTGAVVYATHRFQQVNPVIQLLLFISILTYLNRSYRLILHFYTRQPIVRMDRPRLEFRWLRRLLAATFLLWLLWAFCAAIDYFGFRNQWDTHVYYPFYIFFVIITIWTATAAFLNPKAAVAAQTAAPPGPPVPAELRGKATLLKRAMEANGYYQDPELSLSSLAEKLGLPPNELSRVINTALKINFNDFINEYRVRDAARKMQDRAYDRMTLLGIAFESGFNSKRTFNRVFKEMTGKTPVEFKNSLKKEGPNDKMALQSPLRPVLLRSESLPNWAPGKVNRNFMFRNYLKSTWRNLRKNPLLASINLGGLSVGIAAVLMIGLYIYGETGYDRFHRNAPSIYRVGYRFFQSGKLIGEGPEFTPPFAPDARRELPGIQAFTRVSSPRTAYIRYGDKSFKLEGICYADSSFFHVFSFKLLEGDPASVLAAPHTLVLTAGTAKKLFDAENPIGKQVWLDGQTAYTVTGVAQSAPLNSHLAYNALASFSTLYAEPGNYMDWNGGEQYSAYLQLEKGVDAANLEKRFPAFLWDHINQQFATRGIKIEAALQPLPEIHLHYDAGSGTLRTNLYIFSIVAVLILLISCVNYINLTTAQAATRFKEIGVRKVLGAVRGQLVKQFLAETAFITIAAFCLASPLVLLLAPVFREVTGKPLPPVSPALLPALLGLFVAVMLVGAIAGSYVSYYLSSFTISRIFKAVLPKSSQSRFKKGLIVTQFAIATGLVACTAAVAMQLRYSKSMDMGFDRQQVLVLPLTGENAQKNYGALQQKLRGLAFVQQASAVSEIPYNGFTNNGFLPEGDTRALIVHELDADEHLLETFHIQMRSGSYFSASRPALADGYVINEALAKMLGWPNPIGKTISRDGMHPIIGVVSDFHFASLHDRVEPLIITNKPTRGGYGYLAIKYTGRDAAGLVAGVQQSWKATFGAVPFDYWFLDDAFNTVYKSEEQFRQVFLYFSVLSVALSLAGVFGLVALAVKQRVKEFGIRKVLGAKAIDIILITVKEFAALVVLAAMLIVPAAWYYIHSWLQNFAYHIAISPWLFVVCSAAVLFVTVCVISLQAAKAAMANPVQSLRS